MTIRLPWDARVDSTNWRIFRAATTIALFSVFARAATAAKDLLVARYFGRSDSLDAFLIAYLVPSFVLSLVMGALGLAFIPVFVDAQQKQNDGSTQKLLSTLMLLSTVLLVGIMALLALSAPFYLHYLASGFSAAKLRLTRELLFILLPFGVFGGVAAFVSTVLNARERFALAAVTPVLTPIVMIIFLEMGAAKWGIFSLAAGVITGSIAEAVLLLRALKLQGLRPSLKWNGLDANVRKVLGQYLPMLASSLLMLCTTVVDQAMAAMLPGGSVAALSYGNKVVSAVISVVAAALGTAVLPYFSRMAAESDWNGCWRTVKRYSVMVVLFTVPLAAGIIFFSKPLVRLLFQRGAFTSSDTALVNSVQICYTIQIPFYVWSMLFVRFLSSIRRNHLLMYCSGVSLFLDVVLNLVLMRQFGVAGIALSTSIIYAFTLIFLGTCSARFLAERRVSAGSVVQTGSAVR